MKMIDSMRVILELLLEVGSAAIGLLLVRVDALIVLELMIKARAMPEIHLIFKFINF
uniref:hypothetical protein n=1 Tax=Candidatus Cryptobacteroides bacterium TaxID=3085639 RepID=UPI004026878D